MRYDSRARSSEFGKQCNHRDCQINQTSPDRQTRKCQHFGSQLCQIRTLREGFIVVSGNRQRGFGNARDLDARAIPTWAALSYISRPKYLSGHEGDPRPSQMVQVSHERLSAAVDSRVASMNFRCIRVMS